jgi:predicted metal-dependent peptidase
VSKDPLWTAYIKANWDSVNIPIVNISSLRAFLIRKCPFYTSALHNVNIVLVDDIKRSDAVGFTNGFKVFLNPRMFALYAKYSEEHNMPWFKTAEMGFAFVIMHEVGHIVFDSFGRLGGRNPGMWNSATDFQINQFIVKLMKESNVFSTQESYTEFLNVVMKNFLLDPAKYERMTSEMTYDDLYKVSVGKGEPGKTPGNGGLAGDLIEEDKDMTDKDRMDRDIIKSEMKDYVQKNAEHLRGIGTGMRDFEFMLEPPKVSLRQILKLITDKECTDDWGWNSRGSRLDHLLRDGMRLPVIVQSNPDLVKKVFFVLDSSGSMSDEQLNDALNIVKECLAKYTRQPVYLIVHTSDIVFSQDIKHHDELIEKYSGGTAFIPVIDEIKRVKKDLHIEPSVVIWLTDYYGEIDFEACDLPFHQKKMKWIISGSDLHPKTGATFYIDEV